MFSHGKNRTIRPFHDACGEYAEELGTEARIDWSEIRIPKSRGDPDAMMRGYFWVSFDDLPGHQI